MRYWELGIQHMNFGGRNNSTWNRKTVFLHQKIQEDQIYLKTYCGINSLLIWLLHLVFIFLYSPSVLSCQVPTLRNLFLFNPNYILQDLCYFIGFPLLLISVHCWYLLLLLLFKRKVNISLNQCLSTMEVKYPSESQGSTICSDNLVFIVGKILNSTNDLLF